VNCVNRYAQHEAANLQKCDKRIQTKIRFRSLHAEAINKLAYGIILCKRQKF
jgi:hypothetical protein